MHRGKGGGGGIQHLNPMVKPIVNTKPVNNESAILVSDSTSASLFQFNIYNICITQTLSIVA